MICPLPALHGCPMTAIINGRIRRGRPCPTKHVVYAGVDADPRGGAA